MEIPGGSVFIIFILIRVNEAEDCRLKGLLTAFKQISRRTVWRHNGRLEAEGLHQAPSLQAWLVPKLQLGNQHP